MRKIRYEFLLIAGLIMTLGCATVFANDRDRVKRPKNSGILTVKTDEAYTVIINGERAGMSGVNAPAVFYLTPDEYDIEIEGKDGKILWVERGVRILKNRKHCICLKTVTRTDKEPCPYDVHLEGPSRFRKDEEITITAVNTMSDSPALRYDWKISAGRIISGEGTSRITIDTTGATVIDVDINVNDGKYPQCQQGDILVTEVIPEIVRPKAYICDEFAIPKPDDLKARLDNCTIQIQNLPEGKLYIFIYPAPDRKGNTTANYNRMYKLTTDYLIGKKGLDKSRFEVINGGARANGRFVIWIIPPGADYPVP